MNISSYINAYGKDLSRLCFSLCKNRPDAEDLYQITWEKVLRGIQKYDTSKPFDKWLWTICINAHKDMMKNPFRKRVIPLESEEELEARFRSLPQKFGDLDEYIALHNAVNRLPVSKRQAVALYYFKDLSVSEVSEILGVPEGTVKSRLQSARDFIREELMHE
ncbi:MAG: sigma-70 family RNA polymerase sigma factor [Eubacteriales bacterium]|nr:sigma-70 family RNA polymerase sigma factor [Eubacteriales bacterium]